MRESDFSSADSEPVNPKDPGEKPKAEKDTEDKEAEKEPVED